jgi:predicted RNase H-like nuclease (RuvC/YqgF family)
MTFRTAIIFVVLSCTTMLSTAGWNKARQQPKAPSGSQLSARSGAPASGDDQTQNDQSQNDQSQNDQNQALRNDLTRMKALVQQMETNLAFVDTTQSPLKHQFQLEIDMWKTTINQMERRLPKSHANQVK